MQFYHPFIPPPPILTRESIINEGLKIFEQSKNNEQWLKSWIENKKLSSKSISLSDYRQKLIQHANLLQQYEQALKNSTYEILIELKNQIEQSNNFIYDYQIIKNIQKQIHRRKSKRARLHRQKERKLIPIKSDIIEPQSTNEKPLIEKIQDIKSILQTIEQLKQLKNIRQQQQTDNNDELIEIENICNAKLLEYKTELEKISQSHIKLFNYLFNNNDQSFYESTNPNAQYFLRAHQNINDLIQIRQAWDQYSSTHISSLDNMIPSKWHEPQTPCDSNWTRYIFNKKE
jgi:hypothetical protein